MGPAILVPLALAAVSEGANYANQSAAASREDKAESQAIQDQQADREKADRDVTQTTKQIASDNPDQIAANQEKNFVNELRENAAGSTEGGSTTSNQNLYGQSVSGLPPGTVGSSRYRADTANDQQQIQDYGNSLAKAMAGIDAPIQQRQQEGLEEQTLGTNLNVLNAGSYAQNYADQLRAQAAGQQNPWLSLLSGVSGAAAQGAAGYYGASAAPPNGGFTGNTTQWATPNGTYNFNY